MRTPKRKCATLYKALPRHGHGIERIAFFDAPTADAGCAMRTRAGPRLAGCQEVRA